MVFPLPRKLLCAVLFGFSFQSYAPAAVQRDAAKGADVVELPAFVVDGANGNGPGGRWYYVELPGLRLLSCAAEPAMEQLVSELRDQVRLYGWTLPPELQPGSGAPLSVIIDDRPTAMLRLPLLATQEAKGAAVAPGSRVIGLGIFDWDLASSYHQLVRAQTTSFGAALVSQACNAILIRAPGWSHVQPVLARARGSASAVANGIDSFDSAWARQEVALPLRNVAEFFGARVAVSEKGKPLASEAETARWFGRWLLFADEGRHQAELWSFARGTFQMPRLDDAIAQQYFGLTLGELNQRVGRFRQSNQKAATVHLRLSPVASTPFVTFRAATAEEIACELSQWCVLTWRHNPNLSGPMREAARRAIARVQKSGAMSPRVAGMLGLIEALDGNAERAREILESVPNPMELNIAARFELAKLRFAAATKDRADATEKLAASDAEAILGPLLPFLSDVPGDSSPLLLIVKTWARSPNKLKRDEVAKMAAAARFFPKDQAFLQHVAELCAQQSMPTEAMDLVTIGLGGAQSEEARAKFVELRQRLETRARN